MIFLTENKNQKMTDNNYIKVDEILRGFNLPSFTPDETEFESEGSFFSEDKNVYYSALMWAIYLENLNP